MILYNAGVVLVWMKEITYIVYGRTMRTVQQIIAIFAILLFLLLLLLIVIDDYVGTYDDRIIMDWYVGRY